MLRHYAGQVCHLTTGVICQVAGGLFVEPCHCLRSIASSCDCISHLLHILSCTGMQHAAATAKMLEEILAGCTNPDPAQHGMTTEEERAASNVQVGKGAKDLPVYALLTAQAPSATAR